MTGKWILIFQNPNLQSSRAGRANTRDEVDLEADSDGDAPHPEAGGQC